MDVQLPDGTLVHDVPDGTSKTELATKLKANGVAVPDAWLSTAAPKPAATKPDFDPTAENLLTKTRPHDTATGPKWAAQQLGRYASGIGEGIPTVAENALAGLGAAWRHPFDGDAQAQTADDLSYRPRTEGGNAVVSGFSNLMNASGVIGAAPEFERLGAIRGVTPSRAPVKPSLPEGLRQKITGGADVAGNIKRFEDAGVTNPSAGMVAGNKWLQGAENISASSLGGTSTALREAEKRTADLEGRIGELVEKVAPSGASPTAGGEAITAGLDSWRKRFDARQTEAENAAFFHVKPGDRLGVSNTRKLLAAAASTTPGEEGITTKTGSSTLRDWHHTLEKDLAGEMGYDSMMNYGRIRKGVPKGQEDTVSYDTLRTLRTKIGRSVGNPGQFPDVSKADKRALYAALTKDLEEGFKAKGGAASKAWQRSQDHYREGMTRQRDVLERVAKAGAPDQVFNAAKAGMKDGAARLNRLLNSLPVEERGTVVGSMLDQLGRAAPDAPFEVNRFVNDWGKISDKAKSALLKGQGAKDMDTIVNAATKMQGAGRVMGSGATGLAVKNAHIGETTGIVMSVLYHIANLDAAGVAKTAAVSGAAVGGNYMFQKTMHNPQFLRWLAEGTKVTPKNEAAWVSRLPVLAANARTPEEREAMETLAQQVENDRASQAPENPQR